MKRRLTWAAGAVITLIGAACGPEPAPGGETETASERETVKSAAITGPQWNWCDSSFFTSRGMPDPWRAGSRIGVEFWFDRCEDQMADWELYDRLIDPADALAKRTATGVVDDQYFVLYNRKTGAIRTFLHVPAGRSEAGQYYSVRTRVTNGGDPADLSHGHLAYAGDGDSFVLSQLPDANQTATYSIFKSHEIGTWVVADSYLSWDSLPPSTTAPLFLERLVITNNESEIKLKGSIKPQVSAQSADGPLGLIVGAAFNAPAVFNKARRDVSGAVSTIDGMGTWARDQGATAIGNALISLAGQAGAAGTGIGLVLTGSRLISGFINGADGASAGFKPAEITLEGTISDSSSAGLFRIPLSTRMASEKPHWADVYAGQDERRLGLFNLKRPVNVRLFQRRTQNGGTFKWHQWVSLEDPRCDNLVVNPASGARVQSIHVMPEIRRDGGWVDQQNTSSPRTSPSNSVAIGEACWFNTNGQGNCGGGRPHTTRVKVKVRVVFDIGGGRTFEVMKTFPGNVVKVEDVGTGVANPGANVFTECGLPDFRGPAAGLRFNPFGSEIITGPRFFTQQRGHAIWYVQGSSFVDSGSAIASGKIGDNQTSGAGFTIRGNLLNRITFNWRTSSQASADHLRVYINDVFMAEISGETDWEERALTVANGSVVIFQYEKDHAGAEGADRGYVDNIRFSTVACGSGWDAPCCPPTPEQPFGTCGPDFFCRDNGAAPPTCAR